MTVPSAAPEEPALRAEWQAFIDAMFPDGVWAQDVTPGSEGASPRRLFPAVVVLELAGEFPVLLGQDYVHDADYVMALESWEETEVAGKYAARVRVAASPSLRVWELRSGVPPMLRREEARAQAEVDRNLLRQRRDIMLRDRANGDVNPEDVPVDPPSSEEIESEYQSLLADPLIDEATGVVVPAPVAALRARS